MRRTPREGAEAGYRPSPDVAAGLAGLRMSPIVRLVCLSDLAGHPSPREVRQWDLNEIAAVLVMEEATQEAQRRERARMEAGRRRGGR